MKGGPFLLILIGCKKWNAFLYITMSILTQYNRYISCLFSFVSHNYEYFWQLSRRIPRAICKRGISLIADARIILPNKYQMSPITRRDKFFINWNFIISVNNNWYKTWNNFTSEFVLNGIYTSQLERLSDISSFLCMNIIDNFP